MASTKKIAVVVGVGAGLGTSLAKRFAAGGYSIGLIARKMSNLEPVQKELEQHGQTALCIEADASDAKSLHQAFDVIKTKLGDPEVLLYNAGAARFCGILDLKAEDLQSILNSTVIGGLIASQEVLPSMLKNGKGTILFTGATASMRGSANCAGLAIPKFAVRALSQSMAREYGPKNIHVAHVIIDGQINTPRQVKEQPDRDINSFLNSDAIAETYWQLHIQPKSTWAQEIDLRPSVEKF